jgi:hypothetical protein
LVGTAVNIIGTPAHVGLEPDVTEMVVDGTKVPFTTIVIEFDVVVFPPDVITQVTTCPFVREVVE